MKRRTARQKRKDSAAGRALDISKKITRDLVKARENKKVNTRLEAEQVIQRKSDLFPAEVAREILLNSDQTLRMAGF